MPTECFSVMEILLDLDATGDLIHGAQEGRFFHEYYGNYCSLLTQVSPETKL